PRLRPGKSGRRRGISIADVSANATNARPERPSPISCPVERPASTAGTYHPRVEDFVGNAYRLVLRRDPDPDARAWAASLPRAELIAQRVASHELALLRALGDA